MTVRYEVYANGFPVGSLFKITSFDNEPDAIRYAQGLIAANNRSFGHTVHTQVQAVTTEIVWDSNAISGGK